MKMHGIMYPLSSHGMGAIKLAMNSAEKIHLIVEDIFLDTCFDTVMRELREHLSKLSAKKKLIVAIDAEAMSYRDLVELINWFESIGAASIEIDTFTRIGRGFKGVTTSNYTTIGKYVRQTSIDSDVRVSDLDELLRACPRLTCLALLAMHMRPGRLILPPHVSEFQTCELGVGGYEVLSSPEEITVSSKFVTRLQLATADLSIEFLTLDFPNLHSLVLTARWGFDDITLERMKTLTKDLGRFVLREAKSKWLKTIAPLICNVREEIQVYLDPITHGHEAEEKRKCLQDLLAFMSYPPTTPSILLELPFVEPVLLAMFIKLLVDRCPDLKLFSTTDAYLPAELVISSCYPYLSRASMVHTYYDPVLFNLNLRYIRRLNSTYNREVERLMSDVATQWLIPLEFWNMRDMRNGCCFGEPFAYLLI